jgi:hypothetical protein
MYFIILHRLPKLLNILFCYLLCAIMCTYASIIVYTKLNLIYVLSTLCFFFYIEESYLHWCIFELKMTALLTEFSANPKPMLLNTIVFEPEEDLLSRSSWLLICPYPNTSPSLRSSSNASYSSLLGTRCPIPSMSSSLGPEAISLYNLI